MHKCVAIYYAKLWEFECAETWLMMLKTSMVPNDISSINSKLWRVNEVFDWTSSKCFTIVIVIIIMILVVAILEKYPIRNWFWVCTASFCMAQWSMQGMGKLLWEWIMWMATLYVTKSDVNKKGIDECIETYSQIEMCN